MRLIRQFLEPIQREYLLRLAYDDYRIWTAGSHGTGYVHTPVVDDYALAPLIQRSLACITPEEILVKDVYLIRYDNGASIPLHKDPPLADGMRHGRLNALLSAPVEGGVFMHGAFSPQLMLVRDAVVFQPDVEEHGLTPLRGERLIWSVGCNYRVRVKRAGA